MPTSLAPQTNATPRTESRLGKYQLIAVLGRGGMADVYLAVAQGLIGFNKLMVVKEMRLDIADDDLRETMFLDEARLAARLNHPNIVQTIEVGSYGPRRFLAMEYLDGQPLHRVLRRARERGAPLDVAMSLRILDEVLTGLEYAHSLVGFDGSPLEIVHRDVSPHNVFVTYEGRVKLIDFGIAKTAVASQQTSAGIVKGKIKYMAPEQASARPVDRRNDLFAVGAMLWEAVVGQGPWHGRSEIEIFRALLSGEVPRLADGKHDVDPLMATIVDRAMSVEAADRYPTALSMRDDLEAYVAATGIAPATDRDLSAVLSHLYESDRNELRKLIDAQLLELNDPAPLELVSLTRLRAEGGDATSASRSARVPEVHISIAPSSLLPAARPRAAKVGIVAGAVAVVAIAGTVLLRHASPRPAPPVQAAGAALALGAGPVLPATDSPEASSHVRIRAAPSSTHLYVDDVAVPNPYVGEVARDGTEHRVRAEAAGYATKVHAFASMSDVELDVALEREAVHVKVSKSAVDAQARSLAPAALPPPIAESAPLPKAPTAGLPSQTQAPATSARPKREVDKDDPYVQ